MELPPPPDRSFSSDNAAGAHPAVLDALVAANHGHAVAYGDDPITRRCEAMFGELFGARVTPLLTFNGTGANVLALTTLARPGDAVLCTRWSHINVDEAAAPERIAGVKLIDVDTDDAKLRPEHITHHAAALGSVHQAQPTLVSLTQPTELGTLYRADEIGTLVETAHRYGMHVHVDGARLANAVAAAGDGLASLRAMTIDCGVDVVSFGGTKNGLVGGDAVVFLKPGLADRAHLVRKTVTQLASKMRFVAAQFTALLDNDLWIELGAHANQMANRLHEATAAIDGVEHGSRPAVNSLFPRLPAGTIAPLQAWSYFWDWDLADRRVRWMTAWDTTSDDVERFAAGVAAALAARPPASRGVERAD